MTATPYPLPRETRETAILLGNGTVGPYGPTVFKVFDTADVWVYWKQSGEAGFTPAPAYTVAKTNPLLALDTVSVTFPASVPATTQFVITSKRVNERSIAVTKAGTIDSDQLEKELSKQASVLEEIRRDLGRTVQTDFDVMNVRLETVLPGFMIMQGPGNTLVQGLDVAGITTIANAAAYAAVNTGPDPVGAIAAGTLFLSSVIATTFPVNMKAISVKTYQDAAGEREVVELIRLTGAPGVVKAGHLQDAGGTWWRINAKAAKPTFFADMNGAAAGIRTALQSALDMAVAFPGMTGGRVEFCAGTFNMLDVKLTISGKTILSAPYGDCILQRSIDVGQAAYDGAGLRPPVLSATTVDHIRISGVKCDYTAGGTTTPATNSSNFSGFFFSFCNDVVVEDCVVSGAYYMGVVFNGCTNFRAEWNEVDGVVNRAFYLSTSADNFRIAHNKVNGYQIATTTRYTNYAVNFLHVAGGAFTNGTVANNEIAHMSAHGVGVSGRCQDLKIVDNSLTDITFHGVLCQDISAIDPSDIVIRGNTVSACLAVGIYVLNSLYVNVTGNIARTCLDGFIIEGGGNHVIVGNQSRNNTGYGIKFNTNSANNLANSNATSTNLVGIGEIGGAAHNLVHGNVSVADTTHYGAAGTGSVYSDNLSI